MTVVLAIPMTLLERFDTQQTKQQEQVQRLLFPRPLAQVQKIL
jgi:hypothetical protein